MDTHERITRWLLCRCSAYRIQPKLVLYNETSLRAQWADYKTDMTAWNPRRVLDSLLSLARNGEICFWREDLWREEPGSNANFRTISTHEVLEHDNEADAFWKPKDTLFYGFTEKGGKHWEDVFKPDWNRFDNYRSYANETKVLLTCGSQERCFALLGAFLDYMGWDKRFGLQNLRTGVMKKWKATYWKTLDNGFFARASVMPLYPPADTLDSPYLKKLCVRWEDLFSP